MRKRINVSRALQEDKTQLKECSNSTQTRELSIYSKLTQAVIMAYVLYILSYLTSVVRMNPSPGIKIVKCSIAC
jgi:hypothetical protein